MKTTHVKNLGMSLSIALAAALAILQLSGGGGRLTATSSGEPTNEGLGGGTGFEPVNVPQASPPAPRVIAEHPPAELVENRDDHTRIWEIAREVETTHPDGSVTVDTVKSYIHEKASGLCYKDASGSYVPSVAEWRETPDGFVIDRCAYGLAVGKTIGVTARYTVEGNDLLLRPAYLIVSDGVNEANVATLTSQTAGFISPDNPSVLRFPSAFGEGYDLEYVAEKGGFHQNLIIAKPPEIPEGFDPDTAYIHLYTELNLDQYLSGSGCEVAIDGETVDVSAPNLTDHVSDGGSISFRRPGDEENGILHAFAISEVSDTPRVPGAPAQTMAEKRLLKDSSTAAAYLVESVPVSYFQQPNISYPVVWDPVQKSGTIGSEIWEPRNTYWITGDLNVSGGTLTILPGTTLKLNPSTDITMLSGGRLVARGEPYRYVTVTKASDTSCGEALPSPPAGHYSVAFTLAADSSANSAVQYCKFGHGWGAICCYKSLNHTGDGVAPLAHNTIWDMRDYGIKLYYCSTDCRNNLIQGYYAYSPYRTVAGIYCQGTSGGDLSNNTIDYCQYGIRGQGCSYPGVTAMNDVLTSNLYYGIYANTSYLWFHHNRFYGNGSPSSGGTDQGDNLDMPNPYDTTCPGCAFFVTTQAYNSYLKDQGYGSSLAAHLDGEQFSMVAPTPERLVSGTYTPPGPWGKMSTQDTGQVDIGYHHNRLDYYLTGDLTITGASTTLEILPGTVVVIGGDESDSYRKLRVQTGAKLTALGDPNDGGYILFIRRKTSSMAVESPHYANWRNGEVYITSTNSKTRIEFCRFERGASVTLYTTAELEYPIASNRFTLTDKGVHLYYSTHAMEVCNNLFHWNSYGYYQRASYGIIRNNTFDENDYACELLMNYTGSPPYHSYLRDNLFSGCSYGIDLSISSSSEFDERFNAFYGNTYNLRIGGASAPVHSTDLLLPASPYPHANQGYKEDWYLEQSGKAVNGGSQSSCDAGLRYFTTAESGSLDQDEVDIGYHHLTTEGMYFVDPANGVNDPDDPERGSYRKPFRTIQFTIDLERVLEGNSLILLPGNYFYAYNDPGIEVPKCVNILGSGAPKTIITGDWDPAGIYGTRSDTPLLRIVPGGDGTTIEGVTIQHRITEDDSDDWGVDKGFGAGIRIGAPVSDQDPWGEWNGVQGVSIRYCTIRENHADFGGGICCVNSDAAIENCLIYGNICFSGWMGGGVFCRSGFSDTFPTIRNCTIVRNGAGDPGEFGNPQCKGGAGIACSSSSPTITACIIANNATNPANVGYGPSGGGIRLAKWFTGADPAPSSPSIQDSLVANNVGCNGGGLAAIQDSEALVERCLISDNSAFEYGGGLICSLYRGYDDKAAPRIYGSVVSSNTAGTGGGAVYSDNSSPLIVNCTISHNNILGAEGRAGGLYFDETTQQQNVSFPEIRSCTIAYNQSLRAFPEPYDAIYNPLAYCNITLTNSVMYYNGPGDLEEVDVCGQSGYPRYCNLKNLQIPGSGPGNVDYPPVFMTTATGPLHLDIGYSPSCREIGSNDDAYDRDGIPPPDPDVDGDDRVIDCDNSEGATIDMGADEVYPFKADCKIQKQMNGSAYDITLTWRSPDYTLSPTYKVYRSFEPYADEMAWELVMTKGPDGPTTSWEDHIENGDTRDQAYYRILRTRQPDPEVYSDPVGFVNVPVQPGYNLISVPLQTRYDGINEPDADAPVRVGAMIGERLPSGESLRLWVLKTDESGYEGKILTWDNGTKKWMENGAPGARPLVRGDSAVLHISAGGPAVITFLGWVPMDMGKVSLIRWEDKTDLQTAWGNPYPAETSLDEISFRAYGTEARPSEDKEEADRIRILPEGGGDPADDESWIELYLTPDNIWRYFGGAQLDQPASQSLLQVAAGKGFHYVAKGYLGLKQANSACLVDL